MNIDPKIGILIGGVITFIGTAITVYYSYQNNVNSSKKNTQILENTDKTFENTDKLLSENSNLKQQVSELKDENLILHRQLNGKSDFIINNLTGGESYPLITYSYDPLQNKFSVKASLVGENAISINNIEHINIYGREKFIRENPQKPAFVIDPRHRQEWSKSLIESEYGPKLKSAVRLIQGNSQEILESWDMSLLSQNGPQIRLETKIYSQSKIFIQETDLLWLLGLKYPIFIVLETTVFQDGKVLYNKNNKANYSNLGIKFD